MSDEFDFDYQPSVQTETAQQPTMQYAPPAQAQPVQQPVANQTPKQEVAESEMGAFNIPDLRKGSLSVITLNSNYWEPQKGDIKFGVVRRFENRTYKNRAGELETHRTLIFAEQLEDLSWVIIENSGVKLVSTLEEEVNLGAVIPNKTGIFIHCTGSTKTKGGGNINNFEIRVIS